MSFQFCPLTRDLKRDAMIEHLVKYAQIHVDNIIAARADPKFKLKKIAVTLNTCTTGLGKSSAVDFINDVLEPAGLPLLIVVNNHLNASEYVKRIPGVLEYWGKQMTLEQWADEKKVGPHPSPKSICYKIDVTKKACEKGHRPSADLCKNKCEFGKAGAIKFGKDSIKIFEAQQWMRERGFDESTTPHCPYLYEGMVEARSARVLVMQISAFSENFANFDYKKGNGVVIDKVQRLVIFDEKIEVTKQVEVGSGDISDWIDGLQPLKNRLAEKAWRLIKSGLKNLDCKPGVERRIQSLEGLLKTVDVIGRNKANSRKQRKQIRILLLLFLNNGGFDGLEEEAQCELKNALKLLSLLGIIRKMFETLSVCITKFKPIPSNRILSIYKMAKKVGAFVRGTARWEQISFEGGEYTIPLRALQLMAANLEGKTSRQVDNRLYIYEVTPPIEWSMRRGSSIFLDATASPSMEAIIQSMGGSQFGSVVAQNMRVVRIVGKKYGKGNSSGYGMDAAKIEAQKIANAKKQYEQLKEIAARLKTVTPNRKCAVLTHKSTFQLSFSNPHDEDAAKKQAELFFIETGGDENGGVKAGWFNNHDRAHNQWAGYNLGIVGMEWLPKEEMLNEYNRERVGVQFSGGEWPEWDGEVGKDFLPNDPKAREFFIKRVVANLMQAVGRSRALNFEGEPIHVELWGGLQTQEVDDALFSQGIQIAERIPNPLHLDRQGYYNRVTNIDKIDEVIEAMKADGSTNFSFRAVGDAMRAAGGAGDDKVIKAHLNKLRNEGKLPPASRGGRPRKS